MKKITTLLALIAITCAFTLGSCASKKQAYTPAPMAPEIVVTK